MTKILKYTELYILLGTVWLLPLFVLPLSPNPFVVSRLALLVIGLSLTLIVKALRRLSHDHVEYTSGTFDLPVFLLSLVTLASVLFTGSLNKMDALLLPGTATLLVATGVLYFLLNQLGANEKNRLQTGLVISTGLFALTNILAAVGAFRVIPFLPSYMKNLNFNLEGSFLTTAVFLLSMLPIATKLILNHKNIQKKIIFIVAMVFMLINLSISVYYLLPNQEFAPRLPDLRTSWIIMVESIKQNPLLGSGAGNYVNAFSRFRPITFNQSDIWATKFTTSHDFYLTTITELGLLSLMALFILLAALYRLLRTKPEHEERLPLLTTRLLQTSLVILLICLGLFHGSILLIVLMYVLLSLTSHHQQVSLSLTSMSESDRNRGFHAILSSKNIMRAVAIITIVSIPFVVFRAGKIVHAESLYTRALQAFEKNDAGLSYELMRQSISRNSLADRYHLSFSQLNLALANVVAKKGNPSDQERNTITQLVQQAISEGKAAVGLNPQRSANWENLARIYQSVIPLARGADSFALQSYQQALALDPFNPNLRIALGGLYFAAKNTDQALRMYELAVLTKPDLPNARYNLAYALKEKGDIKGATAQLKLTLELLDPNSQDYKKVQKELEDWENQQPTENASSGENLTTPPETQQQIKPPIELGEESQPPAPAVSPEPSPAPSVSPTSTPSGSAPTPTP